MPPDRFQLDHAATGMGESLVEQRQRITNRTFGRARDEAQRIILRRLVLGRTDARKMR